ncbi:N-acetyltransferase family protein [Rhodopila sp.]|uniref:GNAT family N-acetyltransferase n=1 Tax=Rhodopila sp. TaxID=2480087 RepID=UPI003D12A13F
MLSQSDPANFRFRIRNATATDVGHILRLVRALAEYERMGHEVTATEAEMREALFGTLPRAHALLAEVAGEPVGLALFYYTLNTFKLRPNIFLEDLFVDPANRGSGIGIALMRALARRAEAENCSRVEWRVLDWNQPSIEFYRRIGAESIKDWHTLLLDGAALAALAEGTSHD